MFSMRLNRARPVDDLILDYLRSIPARHRTEAIKQLLAKQLAPRPAPMRIARVAPHARKGLAVPKRLNAVFALQVMQAMTSREVAMVEAVARHPFLSCADLVLLIKARSRKGMGRSLHFLNRMRVLTYTKAKIANAKAGQYLYVLDQVGAIILSWRWRQHPNTLKRYLRLTERQIGYLDHTVEINRFFLSLLATARQHDGRALEVWRSEAQSLTRFKSKRGRTTLRPDGYGVYRVQDERYRFFLEWDRGNSVMAKYRAKFERYVAYYDAVRANPDQYVNGAPMLWVVTTTTYRETFAVNTLQRLSWEYAIDIPAFTTIRALTEDGFVGPIWRSLGDDEGRTAIVIG